MPADHAHGTWITPVAALLGADAELVNTTVAGVQTQPAAAELADGGYVVVWVSNGTPIYSQRYDASGEKVGAETLVTSALGAAMPAVAGLSDGGYVVVYWHVSFDGVNTTQGIYAQRFDATGAPTGAESALAYFTQNPFSRSFATFSAPSVAPLEDGGYVVAWHVETGTSTGELPQTGTQRHDGQGIVTSGAYYSPSSDAVVASTSDGGYLLAYHVWHPVQGTAEPTPYFAVLRFDSSGATIAHTDVYVGGGIATRIPVGPSTFFPPVEAIAQLADGGYVLTGLTFDEARHLVVFRYQFDAAGARVDLPEIIGATNAQLAPALAVLGDGSYVIAWPSDSAADATQLQLQRFAVSGAPLGDALHVDAPAPYADTAQVRLTALGDGGFALTWTVSSAAGGLDVLTQVFEDARLGTGDADHLLGTDASDIIYGLAGADHILGLDGNDKLDGGEGRDTMAGGPGNDRYVVDNIHDRVVEHRNEGLDTVYSSVGYELGANVENLVLTGGAAIDGTGNALDNAITGNAADNRLAGERGSDTLDGAGGRDTLVLDDKPGAGSVDTLLNFVAADDMIELAGKVFRALGATGPLSADAFQTGAAAIDASDRIVYDPSTGVLLYDPDGRGDAAAVQIAALVGLVGTLSADNFVVA